MPNAFQMTQAWVNYWIQTDTSGTNTAIDVTVSSSPAAASSADNGAIAGTVKTNGSQNLTGSIKAGSFTSVGAGTGTAVLINGVTISASNTGHTTLTTVSGQSISVTSSTGTVTTIVGADITAGASGGTVTSIIGARINAPAITTITPTNAYGLYLGAVSGATNNWSIYSAGGDVQIMAGDVIIGTAGKGLKIKTGSNATAGVSTLSGGTLVVSNTKVTANSIILLTCQTPGGTPGHLRVSARTPGTSFTILSSSGTDTSDVGWVIIEPAA